MVAAEEEAVAITLVVAEEEIREVASRVGQRDEHRHAEGLPREVLEVVVLEEISTGILEDLRRTNDQILHHVASLILPI